MNRSRLIQIALLSAALACGGPAGCKKTEKEEEAALAVAAAKVSDEQRTRAKREVQKMWDQVRPMVTKTYNPTAEDMSFYLDLAVLTRHPHRLAGFGSQPGQEDKDLPGSISAARFVANRLMAMGFEEVFTQEFPVVQPIMSECRIVVDGESFDIDAVRPNILQASVTPEEGITRTTMYVGRGEIEDYGNRLAKDKIVVMDFDCGKNWLNAYAFGARAVLFVGGDGLAANAYHHVNIPANLPRFYVTQDLAGKLELTGRPRTVTLHAAFQWGQLSGRNIVTAVRGTNPKFVKDRQPAALLLAAPLDSYSEVPLRSPGARDAANCAALLRLAERLKNDPPRRDVILAFFDAQAQNHLGARAFYGGMYRRMGSTKIADTTLEDRLDTLETEREYRLQIRSILDEMAPLTNLWTKWAEPFARRRALLDQQTYLEDNLKLLSADLNALDKAEEKLKDSEEPDLAERALLKERTARVSDEMKLLRTRISEEAPGLDRQMAPFEAEMADPKLAALAPFGDKMRAMRRHEKAMRFLRNEAKNFDSDVLDKLRPMRVTRNEIIGKLNEANGEKQDLRRRRRDLREGKIEVADLDAALKAIDERIAEQDARIKAILPKMEAQDAAIHIIARRDKGWNDVIRDLFGEEEITPEARGRFARLIAESRKLLDRRLEALDKLTAQATTALGLRTAFGPKRNEIVLHVSINLGDARKQWTFVHGDDTAPLEEDKAGIYKTVFRTMREVRNALKERAGNFDGRAVSEKYENRLFAPGLFADSGAVARIFALYNVSAMTSLDNLPRQGLPGDTLKALQPGVVLAQLDELGPFLKGMGDDTGLAISPKIRPVAKIAEASWSGDKSTGGSIKRMGAGSAVPDRPVRHAVVAVARKIQAGPWNAIAVEEIPPGFVPALIVMTDTNGIFEVGPYSETNYQTRVVLAALFDRTPIGTDEIPKEYRSQGVISAISTAKTVLTTYGSKLSKVAVILFKTRGKTLVGYGFNRGAIKTIAMRAESTAKFRADRHLLCEMGDVLTLYAPYDAKGLKLFNKAGLVLLNNAATKAEYQGKGISLEDQFEHPVTPVAAAHDLGMLNSYRLELLRKSRINQESLERLNGEAQDLESDADAQRIAPAAREAAELKTLTDKVMGDLAAPATLSRRTYTPLVGVLKTSTDKVMGDLAAAAALSRRAYTPLIGVMNDLVTAVVLLLLLAMPFAFALERLLIGSPHIYRQIGWFALFFLATFGVLFFVNPAFRIAATPIIIFLAFTIILLSSLVIFIMVRKLQTEIKKMQGLATTVHSADVSRLNTMMAAVNMGISTMRRRPVRTLLTAATVVLLTFTILTFASFGSSWGIRETYEGPMSGAPPRILVRHQLWSPIGEGVFHTLRGHLSQSATVVPRYWVSPTAQQADEIQKNTRTTMELLVASGDAKHITPIAAAIGLDPRDVEKQPHLKALFLSDSLAPLATDGIFLTRAVSKELGLDEDDAGKAKVLLAGRRLTYAGIVTDQLQSFALLENSSMRPVDYQASGGSSLSSFTDQSDSETLSEMPDIESAQFVHYNVDRVVVIPPHVAKSMRGHIRSLTIYPTEAEKIPETALRVAQVSELPTYYGASGGVYRMIFTSLTKASGVKDLLIPVVLGGLIIFATMLGSVSDREREIYTFSSLGLAPPHVASLFFAEAAIYAVVGGMGGYLLGQLVARLLGFLAEWELVSVPTMNYSSTNAIVTVLIVMGTVLISTIYPAMKASRSANPGIQRAWKIPKPVGNLYDLIFPFTVSAYDIIGVVSFLREHFDNYSDTSLGVFANMECHVFRQKDNDMLALQASVALAPFDLGVTQNFAMLSQPSDIEGIDEVRILIYRLSGAHGDWQRSNRVFVNELRKQLLIWRSLPQEIMDRYREKTLGTWDELPVEQVTPESIGEQA